MKILVAEDNLTNQTLMRKLLEKAGYSPVIVENGNLVMAELEKNSYDVILMDLHMPEMDGIECAKMISGKYAAKKPKIIALTADAYKETEDECREAGMDGFLTKPFNLENMLEMLKSFKEA